MTNEALLVLALSLSVPLSERISLANLVGIAFFRRFDVSRGTCKVNWRKLGEDCLLVISRLHEEKYRGKQ